MVGRQRKVVENEESIVKKKPLKKDLEDLVEQLRQELETEKGKVVILDEEVLQLKQKMEGKQNEVEDCKNEIEELKKSKEALEMQIKDTSSKNQQKSSTRKNVETNEEDEPFDDDNNDYHGNITNEVEVNNDCGYGDGDSLTEELSNRDDEATNFLPNRQDLKDIMERVKQEVDRQKKIRQKQLARKQEHVPIQQVYTILSCGFTDKYLQSRKLSNQKSKRGVNAKKCLLLTNEKF